MSDSQQRDIDLVGKRVLHFDAIGIQHSGFIVRVDDEWAYVQSDSPTALDSEWHFMVKLTSVRSKIVEAGDG